MHHLTPLRMKALAASLTALLAASACASSGSSTTADLSAAAPEATSVPTTDAVAAPRKVPAKPAPSTPPALTETAPAPPAAVASAPALAAAVVLPAVEVVDLATGQSVSLDTLAPTGPTLVWFWAPH